MRLVGRKEGAVTAKNGSRLVTYVGQMVAVVQNNVSGLSMRLGGKPLVVLDDLRMWQ